MAKQNRETLKRFFSAGKLPSEEHFADLIDSSLNVTDEGFSKTEEFGFEITPQKPEEETGNLISFFRKLTDKLPSWSISYYGKEEALQFIHTNSAGTEKTTVLSLDKEGKISVSEPGASSDDLEEAAGISDQIKLSVGGAIRAPARVGVGISQKSTVPANGQFHPITETLFGFQALEIVAKVEKRDSNRFSIMHAIALNAFNPPRGLLNFWNRRNRIRVHQSYYSSPRDRLKLKWEAVADDESPGVSKYRLCIKSAFRFPEEVNINYHVTRLWCAGAEMDDDLVDHDLENVED
jgi:hypothetical protein|tara:strand:+ start:6501 stop:7379 length:879 start_codon:yes stop_codon:yes gene_type:complete